MKVQCTLEHNYCTGVVLSACAYFPTGRKCLFIKGNVLNNELGIRQPAHGHTKYMLLIMLTLNEIHVELFAHNKGCAQLLGVCNNVPVVLYTTQVHTQTIMHNNGNKENSAYMFVQINTQYTTHYESTPTGTHTHTQTIIIMHAY